MRLKFLNADLESDDNSIILDGYNLTHRLGPLAGTKLKFDQVARVQDPVSGRNLDRVVLKFYDDSEFVAKVQKDMELEIRRLKGELRREADENRRLVREQGEDRIKAARERAQIAEERADKAQEKIGAIRETAAKKVETLEGVLDEKTEEIFQKIEKEFKTKLKIASDMADEDAREMQKIVSKLTRENELLKASKGLEVMEVVDDSMNGATESVVVSAKKPGRPKKVEKQ